MALGCGSWQAVITGRGGSPVRYELDPAFNYSLPLSSSGSFSIDVPMESTSLSCCEIVTECDPWADEMSFYRDGTLAYCGPIVDMKMNSNGLSITGKDLFNGWMEKRFIDDELTYHQDHAEVFAALVEYAMAKDDSPNLSVAFRNTGIKGNRIYDPSVYRKVSDALNELTGTELDYVLVGRKVLAGDLDGLLPSETLLLSDEAAAEVNINKLGNNLVNDLVVIGEVPAREPTQVSGRATRGVDHYGLLQDSVADLQMENIEDCENSALERLNALYPIPLMVEVTLTPDAEVEFFDLISGRYVRPLFSGDLACLQVYDVLRLENVNVSNDSNGEKIRINLAPQGETA